VTDTPGYARNQSGPDRDRVATKPLGAIQACLKKADAPPSLLDIAEVVGLAVGALRNTIIGAAAWLSF
jgi:hypothetical protein